MALDGIQLRSDDVKERVRLATEFLDPTDARARSYRADIVLMLNRGLRRLVVSIDDIRSHSRELADGILFKPFDFAPCFDHALKQIINTLPDRTAKETDDETMYYVAYSGSFGENACNPRTLGSALLNRMVSLEGIVTKCSLVRPKVVKSVHYNERKNTFVFREYRDQTMSANAPASTSVYPQRDKDGDPLITEYGYCTYRDHQTISIQEMPERAPAEVSMSLWTTTWWIESSLAIGYSLWALSDLSGIEMPALGRQYLGHSFWPTMLCSCPRSLEVA